MFDIGFWEILIIGVVALLVVGPERLPALATFVGLFAWFSFFPLVPGAVFVVGWLVFSGLVASDVRQRIDANDERYELQSYNHWTVYSGLFLVGFVLPIAALLVFSNSFFWGLQPIDSTATYPNARPGDTVLIQKNAFRNRRPAAGELVALRFPGESSYRILRVVAAGNSTVRLSANSVYVGERRLPRAPLETDATSTPPVANIGESTGAPESDSQHASASSRASSGAPRETKTSESAKSGDSSYSSSEFELMVEQNGNQKYVVSVNPAETGKPSFDSYNLAKQELFLLADNRSAPDSESGPSKPRDSRSIGPVGADAIAGKPLYIAWSTDPSSGTVRWGRIGLRLQ